MPLDNSRLNLVVALRDASNAGGVSSKFVTLFMTFNAPNLSFYVFGAKN